MHQIIRQVAASVPKGKIGRRRPRRTVFEWVVVGAAPKPGLRLAYQETLASALFLLQCPVSSKPVRKSRHATQWINRTHPPECSTADTEAVRLSAGPSSPQPFQLSHRTQMLG